MKSTDFNELVEYITERVKSVLITKAGEYASDEDRLHNFAGGARMRKTTRAKALDGMKLKHDMSILDLIEWNDTAPERVTNELIEEKLTDAINYTILLWAILKEDLEKN